MFCMFCPENPHEHSLFRVYKACMSPDVAISETNVASLGKRKRPTSGGLSSVRRGVLLCSGHFSSGAMMSWEPSGRTNANFAPQIAAALTRSFADQLSRRILFAMACGVVMPNAAAKLPWSVSVSSSRAFTLDDVVLSGHSFLPQAYDGPWQKSTAKRD